MQTVTRCFKKHFRAYEVQSAKVLFPVLQRNLADPLPVFLDKINKVEFVTLHHGL